MPVDGAVNTNQRVQARNVQILSHDTRHRGRGIVAAASGDAYDHRHQSRGTQDDRGKYRRYSVLCRGLACAMAMSSGRWDAHVPVTLATDVPASSVLQSC